VADRVVRLLGEVDDNRILELMDVKHQKLFQAGLWVTRTDNKSASNDHFRDVQLEASALIDFDLIHHKPASQ